MRIQQHLAEHLQLYLEQAGGNRSREPQCGRRIPIAWHYVHVCENHPDHTHHLISGGRYRGAYLQVGFITCDPEQGGYERALQYGLAVPDRLIRITHSIEPARHTVLRVTQDQRKSEGIVGDFSRRRAFGGGRN